MLNKKPNKTKPNDDENYAAELQALGSWLIAHSSKLKAQSSKLIAIP